VLEEALKALVAEYNGANNKPRLEIVLAAGNSYLSEGRVVFTRHNGQADHVDWTWRLPPDNTVLCFSEIWMDSANANGVTVTLTSPGGAQLPVANPVVWGNHWVWRLEVGPTISAPGVTANEHGDYTIEVGGIRQNARVDAYVARSDPNMGVRTGAKRSYFVDPKWELTRSAEANCKRTNGELDRSGSLISRFGTLNGIATAATAVSPSVHVAGGYILADGCHALYSSAGPARRGPLARRIGPDFVLPSDESYALGGIRAGGNRSGSVFRLIGTSAAAPQMARLVARPLYPPPASNIPTDPAEREKRGYGNLGPP
jgi:hypothetical protein